jgi:hypothetical protein
MKGRIAAAAHRVDSLALPKPEMCQGKKMFLRAKTRLGDSVCSL